MTKRVMQTTTIILAASAGALALLGFRLVRLAKTRPGLLPGTRTAANVRAADEQVRRERGRGWRRPFHPVLPERRPTQAEMDDLRAYGWDVERIPFRHGNTGEGA